ncbi:parallel beta-helix domain-containing protein [Isoalcanivorax beigongshangi]|uniref:Parallel beta-helix domain-containing protein n=1 Tax=Isoalcanivorax beigongshangi TaxID=3238810 RepID=A0ABV4AHZ6_9GAMM
MKSPLRLAGLSLAAALLVTGCGGDEGRARPATGPDTTPPTTTPEPSTPGRTFTIQPGANATADMVNAMVQLRPGDTLAFACGFFDLTQSLLVQATEDVLIKGCGRDRTVLSFRDSVTPTGLEALNVRGITVEDMTIADPPGDAFKLKGVKWGTLRNVRAIWSGGAEPITAANYAKRIIVGCTVPPKNPGDPTPDYVPSQDAGRYGIYPVESENILVENSESIGASDAGIYVGQTNTAIIRNSRALYNVMGFEIENVRNGEYDSNIAECNTGGFLIYDLENITQYGDTSVMVGNTARNNNTYNFAHGGIVAEVPRGVGFITLGYDNIEVYDNTFEDHSTAAILHVSYDLLNGAGQTADRKLDPYTEGLHVHHNRVRNSGYDLPKVDLGKLMAGDINSLLPTLIGLKNVPSINDPIVLLKTLKNLTNLGRGAHVIWDGLLDERDASCPYPLDAEGHPVPADAAGKPLHTNAHPNPACHYNAYKFDDRGQRKRPEYWSCYHDNEFDAGSATYLNFHGTAGLELVLAVMEQDLSLLTPSGLLKLVNGVFNFPSSTDISVHDCQARFGRVPAALPRVVIPPFERSAEIDPAIPEHQVKALCEATPGDGQINRPALAVNCPLLAHYNLFEDASDPRSLPHEGGVPFVLNTKLFSDYATKYRVAFLPPDTQAVYVDGRDGSNPNGTLHFPVGTVLAKTFAFTDDEAGTETPVETRLLIKRVGQSGKAYWEGLPYLWETGADGVPVARLALGGATVSGRWHYRDADNGALHSGRTDHYSVPNANQCITCHGNDDNESGSAPIGPKPRNLNRLYQPETAFMQGTGQASFAAENQLQMWHQRGLLSGVPALELDGQGNATNVERLPRWNLPGDGGPAAHSKADIEQRLRAYMEVNCQHCHNDRGAASNTGYYLDSFRPVNASVGICKQPTATGGGSCGRTYVVVPGQADASIVTCRMEAVHDPERMMPPIARSVAHDEATALLRDWINQVVDQSYDNGRSCR